MASRLFLGILGATVARTASAASLGDDPFTLYAYSSGINGIPLININNTLYISNGTISEIDSASSVNFTQETNTITATSNGSTSSLAIPTSPGPVVLFNGDSSEFSKTDVVTTGWSFFDGTLTLKGSSSLESLFYAVSTDDPNLYVVSWNTTANDKPLALRLYAPAGGRKLA